MYLGCVWVTNAKNLLTQFTAQVSEGLAVVCRNPIFGIRVSTKTTVDDAVSTKSIPIMFKGT